VPHPSYPPGPVAGLDCGVSDLATADRIAGVLVESVGAQGVAAPDLVMGIHRVVEGQNGPGRLAFSLAVCGLSEDGLWRLATEAMDRSVPEAGSGTAVVVGRRNRGPDASCGAARAAAAEQSARSGGRAVSFAGVEAFRGPTRVRDLVAGSAVDLVVDLTGGRPGQDDLVQVMGPLRPRWQFGGLVLHVLPANGSEAEAVSAAPRPPASGRTFVPFEVPGRRSPVQTARVLDGVRDGDLGGGGPADVGSARTPA